MLSASVRTVARVARAPAALARRPFHVTSAALAEEAGDSLGDGEMRLNFSVPAHSIIANKPVFRVTVPGRAGTYGIQARSPASLSELRPGVVDVEFAGKDENVKYFIPGGFAFTHGDNSVDVSAPDAFLLEDIDADLVRSKAEELRQARDNAADGSFEEAEAKVGLEVYKALSHELGLGI